jgi:hypothetical protein
MSRLRKLLLALGVITVIAGLPTIAMASGLEEPTPVGPDAISTDSALNLPPYVVALLLGTLIPLVNGVVTKLTTSSTVKAIITLVLSAIAGAVNVSLVDGGGAVISWSTLNAAAITFIVAVATYVGVWKPMGVTSSPVTRVDESGALVTEPGKLASVGVK